MQEWNFIFQTVCLSTRNTKLASHLPELSSNILPKTAMDNFSHHHYKLRTASELPDCQQFSRSTKESNMRLSPSLKTPNVPKSVGSSQNRTWLKLEEKRGVSWFNPSQQLSTMQPLTNSSPPPVGCGGGWGKK